MSMASPVRNLKDFSSTVFLMVIQEAVTRWFDCFQDHIVLNLLASSIILAFYEQVAADIYTECKFAIVETWSALPFEYRAA